MQTWFNTTTMKGNNQQQLDLLDLLKPDFTLSCKPSLLTSILIVTLISRIFSSLGSTVSLISIYLEIKPIGIQISTKHSISFSISCDGSVLCSIWVLSFCARVFFSTGCPAAG